MSDPEILLLAVQLGSMRVREIYGKAVALRTVYNALMGMFDYETASIIYVAILLCDLNRLNPTEALTKAFNNFPKFEMPSTITSIEDGEVVLNRWCRFIKDWQRAQKKARDWEEVFGMFFPPDQAHELKELLSTSN